MSHLGWGGICTGPTWPCELGRYVPRGGNAGSDRKLVSTKTPWEKKRKGRFTSESLPTYHFASFHILKIQAQFRTLPKVECDVTTSTVSCSCYVTFNTVESRACIHILLQHNVGLVGFHFSHNWNQLKLKRRSNRFFSRESGTAYLKKGFRDLRLWYHITLYI